MAKRGRNAGRHSKAWAWTASAEEDYGSPIYSIAFCDSAPFDTYFATVGANRATIYQSYPIKAGIKPTIDVAQVYVDDDAEEVFYACSWGICPETGEPLLAIAGFRGTIKMIRPTRREVAVTLQGHGNAVNDMRFHPVDESLLFSCSKDESVRLWNVRTRVCVCIFAGERGHRDEVLSLDIHCLGGALASCGMDNTVKLWSLSGENLQQRIRDSYERPKPSRSRPFPTLFQQLPLFSTAKIHNDYVDCVRWVGNLIMSKSTRNVISLWKPDPDRGRDAVVVLREFEQNSAEIWFMRFALDPTQRLMVAGNKLGVVSVWDADGSKPTAMARLSHPRCKSAVRHACFSADGRTVIVCCDDSSLWRWDLAPEAVNGRVPAQSGQQVGSKKAKRGAAADAGGGGDYRVYMSRAGAAEVAEAAAGEPAAAAAAAAAAEDDGSEDGEDKDAAMAAAETMDPDAERWASWNKYKKSFL